MAHSSPFVSRFSVRVNHGLRFSNPYGRHQQQPLTEFGELDARRGVGRRKCAIEFVMFEIRCGYICWELCVREVY